MNETGNEAGSVTEGLPTGGFDAVRHGLLIKRNKYGAFTPRGHACSNLIEQTLTMATYVRPAWATHESQTLGWRMQQQMQRLARRDSTDRNIEAMNLDRLREVLDYNPETGALTWRFRLSPNCKLGEPAGKIGINGYRKIRIDGTIYTASHLAWFHFHGTPPAGLLDHKNLDKADDRIENLREATASQNCMNQPRNARNTTGFKGVSVYNKQYTTAKFRSSIRHNGKRIFLGLFHTAEAANEAYCKAAAELHGEFARTDGAPLPKGERESG